MKRSGGLEPIAHLKHMHIHARVVLVENTIGHVLQAISNIKVPGEIKIDADVGGKRDGAAQIFISELVFADNRRVDAHGYIQFILKA